MNQMYACGIELEERIWIDYLASIDRIKIIISELECTTVR